VLTALQRELEWLRAERTDSVLPAASDGLRRDSTAASYCAWAEALLAQEEATRAAYVEELRRVCVRIGPLVRALPASPEAAHAIKALSATLERRISDVRADGVALRERSRELHAVARTLAGKVKRHRYPFALRMPVCTAEVWVERPSAAEALRRFCNTCAAHVRSWHGRLVGELGFQGLHEDGDVIVRLRDAIAVLHDWRRRNEASLRDADDLA
jgi:hypothetical protein